MLHRTQISSEFNVLRYKFPVNDGAIKDQEKPKRPLLLIHSKIHSTVTKVGSNRLCFCALFKFQRKETMNSMKNFLIGMPSA